jgi:hypothetical protein
MLKISTKNGWVIKSELEIQWVNWKNNGISCLWSEYLSNKIYRDIEEKREDL